MHALQLLPLLAVLLGWLGRHWKVLADDRTRLGLVAVATVTYAAIVALVTFQALAGQSIVRPDGVFLLAGFAIAVAAIVAVVATTAIGYRLPHRDAAPATVEAR